MASDKKPGCFFVYCMIEDGCPEGPCKVGIAGNLNARRHQLQCGNWRQLTLVWSIPVKRRDDALTIEGVVLGRLRPSMFCTDSRGIRRLKSEWLDATPEAAFEIASKMAGFLNDDEAA